MERHRSRARMRAAGTRGAAGAAVAAIAGMAAILFAAGCSPATPPPGATEAEMQQAARFNLGQCELLEPSLYRCPGIDTPLCDPDFSRNEVECVKVTKNGVILQVPSE
jgi:hypothetical protein